MAVLRTQAACCCRTANRASARCIFTRKPQLAKLARLRGIYININQSKMGKQHEFLRSFVKYRKKRQTVASSITKEAKHWPCWRYFSQKRDGYNQSISLKQGLSETNSWPASSLPDLRTGYVVRVGKVVFARASVTRGEESYDFYTVSDRHKISPLHTFVRLSL